MVMIQRMIDWGAASSNVTFSAGVKVTGFGSRSDGKRSYRPGAGGEVKTLDYAEDFYNFDAGDLMTIDPQNVVVGTITFWLEAVIKIQEARTFWQSALVDYDGRFRYEWDFDYHFVAKGGPRVADLVIENPEYLGSKKYEVGKQAVRLAWVSSEWADGRREQEPEKYIEVLPAFSLPGRRPLADEAASAFNTDADTTFIRPYATGFQSSLTPSAVRTFGSFSLIVKVPEPSPLPPDQQDLVDRFSGRGKWKPQTTLPVFGPAERDGAKAR